jgi:hypothetical protein
MGDGGRGGGEGDKDTHSAAVEPPHAPTENTHSIQKDYLKNVTTTNIYR